MRSLVCSLLAVSVVNLAAPAARAQEKPDVLGNVGQALTPDRSVEAGMASPEATQRPTFSEVEAWRLDAGRYAALLSYRDQDGPGGATHVALAGARLGLTRRAELDAGVIVVRAPGAMVDWDGVRVGVRYGVGAGYGALLGNPTLSAAWVQRHGAADRSELRLDFSGELRPGLLGAANVYLDQSVPHGHPFSATGEGGLLAGLSYEVWASRLRLGMEGRAAAAQTGFLSAQPLLGLGAFGVVQLGQVSLVSAVRALREGGRTRIEPMASVECAL
jgi:hypothetical protein